MALPLCACLHESIGVSAQVKVHGSEDHRGHQAADSAHLSFETGSLAGKELAMQALLSGWGALALGYLSPHPAFCFMWVLRLELRSSYEESKECAI